MNDDFPTTAGTASCYKQSVDVKSTKTDTAGRDKHNIVFAICFPTIILAAESYTVGL